MPHLLLDRRADGLDRLAADEQGVEADEGDARLAIVEDGRPTLHGSWNER